MGIHWLVFTSIGISVEFDIDRSVMWRFGTGHPPSKSVQSVDFL